MTEDACLHDFEDSQCLSDDTDTEAAASEVGILWVSIPCLEYAAVLAVVRKTHLTAPGCGKRIWFILKKLVSANI